MPLLQFTKKGIYCAKADVYIDPWRPVKKALLTHGHADHARYGSEQYICSKLALPVIKYRLGKINITGIEYSEELLVNGVKFSFHPAGHVIGSAQIRVEHKGEIWVVSGDYKVDDDGLSTPFEPIKCQHFVTESTFALPVYQWKSQHETMQEINAWWRKCKAENKVALLTAYSLGKAQRIIQNVDHSIGPIFTHGAIENINKVIREQGIELAKTTQISKETNNNDLKGALVVCPPSAVDTPWAKKLKPYSIGIASGWMAIRGQRRRRAADRGFVLSDHADWKGLLEAIDATDAHNIYVTHGYSEIFSKYLREEKGLNAQVLETEFNVETEE